MKSLFPFTWLALLLIGCESAWLAPADDSAQRFVKLYGALGADRLADFAPQGDGYLLLGSSDSLQSGASDLMLIQTDSAGNQQGQTLALGDPDLAESAVKLLPRAEGWLLLGNQTLPDGRQRGYLVALDAGLTPRWTRTLSQNLDAPDDSAESFILADAVLRDDAQLYWIGRTTDVDPLKNTDGDTLSTGDVEDLWVGQLDLSGSEPVQVWQQRYGFKAADVGVALSLSPDGARLLAIGHSQFPANQTQTKLLLVQLRADGFLLDQQTLAEPDDRAVDLAYDATLPGWQVLSYQVGGAVRLRTVETTFSVSSTTHLGLSGAVPSDLFLDDTHLWITGVQANNELFYQDLRAGPPPFSVDTLGYPAVQPPNQSGRIRSGPGQSVLIGATLGWTDGGSLMMLARRALE